MKLIFKNNAFYAFSIIVFGEFWYYFFQESIVLRPFAEYVWVAFAIIGLVRVIQYKHFQQYSKYYVFVIIVGLLFVISTLYSSRTADSLNTVFRYALYFFAGVTLFSEEDTKDYLKVMYFFAFICLLAVLIEFVLPDLYFATFDKLLSSSYSYTRLHLQQVDGAYVGFANQTTVTAYFLNIGVALCLYRILSIKQENLLIWRYIPLALFLIALLLTKRRGGTAIALFLVLFFLLRNRRTKLTTIILIVFGIIMVLTLGSSIIPGLDGMIQKISANSGDVSNDRFQIWINILSAGKGTILFGNGIGSLSSSIVEISGFTSAHNAYVQLIYEIGIVGLVIFMIPYFYVLKIGFGILKNINDVSDYRELFAETVFLIYLLLFVLLLSLVEATLTNPIVFFVLGAAQIKIIKINEMIQYGD